MIGYQCQILCSPSNRKVAALDLGADDYITKPFGAAELLAAKENKRREIAVIGMVGGDRAGENQPIESFGFYSLSKQDVGALRGIMKQQCPALKL